MTVSAKTRYVSKYPSVFYVEDMLRSVARIQAIVKAAPTTWANDYLGAERLMVERLLGRLTEGCMYLPHEDKRRLARAVSWTHVTRLGNDLRHGYLDLLPTDLYRGATLAASLKAPLERLRRSPSRPSEHTATRQKGS